MFPSLIISSLKLAKRYFDKKKNSSSKKTEDAEVQENEIPDVEEQPVIEQQEEEEKDEDQLNEKSDEVIDDFHTGDAEEKKEKDKGSAEMSEENEGEEKNTTGDAEPIKEEEEEEDKEWSLKMTTLYRFIHQIIMVLLRECEGTESQCVQFALMAGQSADYCEFDLVAYNFFMDAFKIYEENVSHSKAQFNAIVYSIGSLLQTSTRLRDNQHHYYNVLSTKVTLYCTKLLKKPDQSRSIYLASHLWIEEAPQRVLECLQKSLKIADSCMDIVTNELLFLELLNQYIYYYERDNVLVSALLLLTRYTTTCF